MLCRLQRKGDHSLLWSPLLPLSQHFFVHFTYCMFPHLTMLSCSFMSHRSKYACTCTRCTFSYLDTPCMDLLTLSMEHPPFMPCLCGQCLPGFFDRDRQRNYICRVDHTTGYLFALTSGLIRYAALTKTIIIRFCRNYKRSYPIYIIISICQLRPKFVCFDQTERPILSVLVSVC